MPARARISLIIPTRDEQQSIGWVLERVPELVDEIIVVDSSSDETPRIAQSFPRVKLIRAPARGYGAALQTGIKHASGQIIVFMDGDHSYDPRQIPILINPILEERADVVIGSRILGKRLKKSLNSFRLLGNLCISALFSLFFLKLADTQSGFRAIRSSLIQNLPWRAPGMEYATQQLISLANSGARIHEVPITYLPRTGKSKLVAWRDGLRILRSILEGWLLARVKH